MVLACIQAGNQNNSNADGRKQRHYFHKNKWFWYRDQSWCKNVTTTIRSTTIGKEGAEIKTIEHLLAAVYALEIDDLYIEVEGDEIPILDGSSRYFCENIKNAGIIEKEGEKEYFVVDDLFEFKYAETGSEYIALPCDRFEISALIDFKSPVVNKQFAEIRDISTFCDEFADCRTFGFSARLRVYWIRDW